MNKQSIITTIAVALFVTATATAQNVGVGEANPTSKLEIKGSGNTAATSALNVKDSAGTSMLYVQDDHKVGINTTQPDSSAVLDIQSTTAGVLVPRLTDAQMNAVANPATGLLIFNSTQNVFYFYDGNAWVALVASNNNSSAGDPTLVYTVSGF